MKVKILEKKIEEKLKTRKNEDLVLIRQIERFLLTKKSKIINLSQRNKEVILLSSSGLDSAAMTLFLIKKYGLKIHPLFINWGQPNLRAEEKSFDYISKYFTSNFPTNYFTAKKITLKIPPKELSIRRDYVIPVRNSYFVHAAVSYSHFLEKTKGEKIKTILLGSVSEDGTGCPDSTLTSLRTMNLNLCQNSADFSWQVSSLAIEKAIGNYLSKADLLNEVKDFGFQFEKTWSCFWRNDFHCGYCTSCWGRKKAFKKLKIKDKTKYLSQSVLIKIIAKFLNYIKFVFEINLKNNKQFSLFKNKILKNNFIRAIFENLR
jgi:7-cyano-7-deazaguanine synthase